LKMMNLKNFRIINLNSFILIIFLILFLKNVSSIENKIIFKINDYAFTSYDYEMRIRYLDFIGGEKISKFFKLRYYKFKQNNFFTFIIKY